MIDTDNPVIEFTALDRCDRCGAQARSVAQQAGMSDLLFCNHHKRENYDALLDSGWTVVEATKPFE